MVKIVMENAWVEFPVYNSSNRSLKNAVLKFATGGVIDERQDGRIFVRGLEDVTLRAHEGERIGLVGHNGAGKTTMLRVLSGIYRPSRGTFLSEGNVVSLININLGIDPEATGRENLRLRAALMGLDMTEAMEADIIDFTGLGDFIDMPLRTYSTGMQLRLAFSISTAVTPDILIMDEWLSTGDEDFKERSGRRMTELLDKTKILIIASHSRELIASTCTRVIWMEHGRVRMDGAPAEVCSAYFG